MQEDSRESAPASWPSKAALFQWLVAFMAGYLVLVLTAVWLFDDFNEQKFWQVNARWPREGQPVFLSRLATWDAAHYLYLSEVGYAKDVPSCAFYPLWPMLVRGFSVVTGGNHVVAGMILANLFASAGGVIFFGLVRERFGLRVAGLVLAFLFAFPGSLFFHFVYSEGLFFLLLMLFVLGLERRWHGLVWASGFLLPMTRAVGVFCVFPLLWHILQRGFPTDSLDKRKVPSPLLPLPNPVNRSGFKGLGRGYGVRTSRASNARSAPEPPLTRPSDTLSPPRGEGWGEGSVFRFMGRGQVAAECTLSGVSSACELSGLALAPMLGYAAYFGLMWHWTGNPWEGFQAQRFWNYVHSIGNLFDPWKFIVGFFTPWTWHEFRGSVLDRCLFMLLLYCLPVIWRLDKGWFVWALVLGMVPAMSGTFTSFTRFASVVFPMFIAVGVVFSERRWRWYGYGLLGVFGVLQVILVWRFVNFRWAG